MSKPITLTKILVVDDEPDLEYLIRQKFRKQIREQKYEFLFAKNGVYALEQLEEHPDVDLVLSDINMPEMDGLTLLLRLQEKHGLLKAIVVSAYGDMENIRTAMNRGAFDFITKPINFEDLEITIQKTLVHVLHIKQTLQAIKENNILKMYVDETVLNFMGDKKFEKAISENEQVEGTVAFIDICGFTSISELEEPDKVVTLLNAYFDVIVQEVIAHQGSVDKFIGDAVMALFRGEFHLDRALDAALAINTALAALPDVQTKSGFKPLVSIGINSGEMVSGNIGSKKLKRLDFTVIGDTVNVAARLQSAAGQGQILITKANYELIKNSFNCHLVGEIKIKNKANPLVVYEVLQ